MEANELIRKKNGTRWDRSIAIFKQCEEDIYERWIPGPLDVHGLICLMNLNFILINDNHMKSFRHQGQKRGEKSVELNVDECDVMWCCNSHNICRLDMLRNRELICTDSIETTFKKTRWSLIELGLLHVFRTILRKPNFILFTHTKNFEKTPIFCCNYKGSYDWWMSVSKYSQSQSTYTIFFDKIHRLTLQDKNHAYSGTSPKGPGQWLATNFFFYSPFLCCCNCKACQLPRTDRSSPWN